MSRPPPVLSRVLSLSKGRVLSLSKGRVEGPRRMKSARKGAKGARNKSGLPVVLASLRETGAEYFSGQVLRGRGGVWPRRCFGMGACHRHGRLPPGSSLTEADLNRVVEVIWRGGTRVQRHLGHLRKNGVQM